MPVSTSQFQSTNYKISEQEQQEADVREPEGVCASAGVVGEFSFSIELYCNSQLTTTTSTTHANQSAAQLPEAYPTSLAPYDFSYVSAANISRLPVGIVATETLASPFSEMPESALSRPSDEFSDVQAPGHPAEPLSAVTSQARQQFAQADQPVAIEGDEDLVLAGLEEDDEEAIVVEVAGQKFVSDLMDMGKRVTGDFLVAFTKCLNFPPTSARYQPKQDLEIGRLAYNLFEASTHASGCVRGVAVPRDSNAVANLACTRGASPMAYEIALAVQKRALACGLVDEIPGQNWGKKKERHRTVLVPTAKLVEMARANETGTLVKSTLTYGRVYIRGSKGADGKKPFLKVFPDQDVKRMQAELHEINERNALAELRNANTGISFANHMKQLDRVFNNGGLDDGGRAYGAYQNCPSDERLAWTIDGEPGGELDFSAFHPGCVLNLAGTPAPEDLYAGIDLPDFASDDDKKDAVKRMVVILINSKSVASANRAGGRAFSQLTKGGKRKKHPPKKLPAGVTAAKISAAFLALHPLLAAMIADMTAGISSPNLAWMKGDLSKGMGVKLQRLDSDLAVAVSLRFARLGKPCFPIHDSFVVKESDLKQLDTVMREEYARIFKFQPQIKPKVAKVAPTVDKCDSATQQVWTSASDAIRNLELVLGGRAPVPSTTPAKSSQERSMPRQSRSAACSGQLPDNLHGCAS